MIYFITVEKFKSHGFTHDLVDTKIIKTAFERVQDLKIQEATGSILFDALKDKIENDALTGDYLKLMTDYIHPCMIAWTDKFVAIYNNTKIRNKSTGKSSDQYINAIDLTTQIHFKDDLNSQAESYQNILIKYLRENCDKFPEYVQGCSSDSLVHPRKRQIKTFY